MRCAELEKLRARVHEIQRKMAARRERALYMAQQSALAERKDERHALLERKLVRSVADIEQHVARHQCQE